MTKTFQYLREIITPRYVFQLLLVFAAYFLTAKLGLELNAVSGFATLVWPPAGIALVALLVFGYRLWPGVASAAFLINLLTGAPIPIALAIALGNTLEAVVAVFLLRQLEFHLELETMKDGLLFKLFAALCAIIAATIGVSILWFGGIITIAQYPETWFAWWIGDTLGVLIIGNLLLNVRKLFLRRNDVHLRVFEVTLFVVTLSILSAIVFLNPVNPAKTQSMMPYLVYLISPLLVWAAIRFGTIGSAFTIFAISIVAIFGTILGKGPFTDGSLSNNLLVLQIFMGSITVTTMVLATAVGERLRAVARMREMSDRSSEQVPTLVGGHKKNVPMREIPSPAVVGKLFFVLFGFLFISGTLLSLNYVGMQTLSSIRAYVAGEGLWSKAQKDAVYQLHLYALSHDENDFEKYKQFIAVPLGDKKARIELEKSDADLEHADKAFLEGRNDPDDVRNMSLLFRRFRHFSYLEKAISIWEEGDARITMLMTLADKLHDEISSGNASPAEVRKTLKDINAANAELTALEDNFSFTLGEAARWVAGVLIFAMLVVTVLLIIPCLAVALFIIRNIGELDRAKTEFISLTSHQLRTPPTGIKWYAAMLLDEDVGTLTPAQQKYLQQITYNNQRMIDVVDSVLNISQIELGTFQNKPTPTDVCALIDKLFAEFAFQITERNLQLSRHYQCGPHLISIDPTLLRFVAQNLLSNAVKYTHDGGTIDLSVLLSGAKLSIVVKDTGRGIPEKDFGKIFQKFFRASNVEGWYSRGTGLGLYIVKRILDQIGGTIKFTSELEKGTTFTVSIPTKVIGKVVR